MGIHQIHYYAEIFHNVVVPILLFIGIPRLWERKQDNTTKVGEKDFEDRMNALFKGEGRRRFWYLHWYIAEFKILIRHILHRPKK